MESDIRYLNVVRKHVGKIQFRQKLNLFLFCLVIAIILWFVIKYSKYYQSVISYKVSLYNFPESYIPQISGDSILHVNVNAQGFTLLYHSLFQKEHRLNLDVGSLYLRTGTQDAGIIKITLPSLKQKIENILPKGLTMKELSPNSLRIRWERSYYKKIPVHLQFKASFEQNYQIYGSPKIFPDSIWIKGNRETLHKIKSVSTFPIRYKNLRNTIYTLVPLDLSRVENISAITKNVILKAEVYRFTEQEIEVPVTYDSTLNKREYRIFPDKVKLRYMVSLKDYKNITPSQFKVTVSHNSENTGNQNKLKVNLIYYPDNIRNIRIEPEKIEFIQLR